MKSQMDTTAVLIIAILVLGIGILFFMKLGFLDQMLELVAVPFNSIMSMLRGMLISGLWSLVWPLVGIATLMIWTSPTCYNPLGLGVCTGIEAASMGIIATLIIAMFSAIPLFHIPIATIHLGKIDESVSPPVAHSVSISEIMKRVADGVVECFQMYGANHYDPLVGVDPPNPADCFSMEIVPDTGITLNKDTLIDWMNTHQYPSGDECSNDCISYAQKIVDLGGSSSYADNYINIPSITLTAGKNNLIYIKYFDKYDYSVNFADSQVCFNTDCGYSEDSCDGFTHDMVVLCG